MFMCLVKNKIYKSNKKLSQLNIKKEIVIDYVGKVKKLIESYGVRCELEGVPSARILRSN